jgi:hypothetical protein
MQDAKRNKKDILEIRILHDNQCTHTITARCEVTTPILLTERICTSAECWVYEVHHSNEEALDGDGIPRKRKVD